MFHKKINFLFIIFSIYLNFTNLIFCDLLYEQLNLFNDSFVGVLAAYGDYNADKNVDIFTISDSDNQIDVWLANENGGFYRQSLLSNYSHLFTDTFISGVMVTDFDGDGFLDLLLNRKMNKDSKEVFVQIFWGSKHGLESPFHIEKPLLDEPILFDFNSDMRSDLLTVDFHTKALEVWMLPLETNSKNGLPRNKIFQNFTFPSYFDLFIPHSSAFLQYKNAMQTDLLVTTANKEFKLFIDGDYSSSSSYKIETTHPIGQSAFADIDEDGEVEHLLPVGNQIQAYSNNSWHLLINLEKFDYTFDYNHHVEFPVSKSSLFFPPTLSIGDCDNDGFPDVLTVVKQNNQYVPILMRNLPCDINNNCVGFGRQLQVQKNIFPAISQMVKSENDKNENIHVHSVSFFDYLEDGTLDILLVVSTPSHPFHPVLLKNNMGADSCFIKVTVTNGLLQVYPSKDSKPFGVNSMGASVVYETTKIGGEKQKSCSSQLTQSSHFSLQLPFVLFGLGQTPNFVDNVWITLPKPINSTQRSKQWTQIIPNSQLLVNPHPPYQPYSWTMQLFVMPSKQIFTTTAVLGGTCIFLVFVVGGLLYVEKKEDKAVRNKESQRFHFDAM